MTPGRMAAGRTLPRMPVTTANVDDVFTYHAPTGSDPEAYEAIRTKARELAHTILDLVPTCGDQQAALRLLREAVMTANAAIALKGRV